MQMAKANLVETHDNRRLADIGTLSDRARSCVSGRPVYFLERLEHISTRLRLGRHASTV